VGQGWSRAGPGLVQGCTYRQELREDLGLEDLDQLELAAPLELKALELGE
jgi:hypothetical protein